MASIIKYADLQSEYIDQKKEIDSAIQRCLDNDNFILGQAVQEFEATVKEHLGCDFVGVASGTSSLHLALLALDIKPGDEIIVPSMTFMSTAEMVAQIGAVPVFADIDQYYLIDIDSVKKKITDRTRAIIAVDLYGQCIDFEQWQVFRSQGIKLIQDAAQSWGIKYKGNNTHTWVDAQCWSFYPGKNLSAIGDAGGVSGSLEFVDRVRQLSNHGRSKKYVHTHLGWNQRMDAVQAAVLNIKINRQEWALTNKRQAATRYTKILEGTEVIVPKVTPWHGHTWNQYVVQVPNRNELFELLGKRGIQCGMQYPIPLHLQGAFSYLPVSRLPYTEDHANSCLCLPMHAYLSYKQVDRVCETLLWHLGDSK